jgi:hypothetical protein
MRVFEMEALLLMTGNGGSQNPLATTPSRNANGSDGARKNLTASRFGLQA